MSTPTHRCAVALRCCLLLGGPEACEALLLAEPLRLVDRVHKVHHAVVMTHRCASLMRREGEGEEEGGGREEEVRKTYSYTAKFAQTPGGDPPVVRSMYGLA